MAATVTVEMKAGEKCTHDTICVGTATAVASAEEKDTKKKPSSLICKLFTPQGLLVFIQPAFVYVCVCVCGCVWVYKLD